jgi:phosphohistidine phosphatase
MQMAFRTFYFCEEEMKTIYLLRHAKASKEDPSTPDIRRPLTDQGFHDARLVSEALRQQDLIPQTIISSDAVRAYTTAFVFAATFEKLSGDILLENSLYECEVKDYLKVISGISENFSSCMIVGHNNTISMVVEQLLRINYDGMKTAGVVIISSSAKKWIEFDSHQCKLVLELYPSLLQ